MADEEANKKLDELREKARQEFSDDELETFINMGKRMAGKPVLHCLNYLLKEGPDRGLDKRESEKLVKKITKRIPYNHAGYVQSAFVEFDFKLNICLSLVDKGYKTDIDIPDPRYARDLFNKYDYLKSIAIAFWKQFMEENPELIERISKYMPDVDFTNLKVDPENITTMYFDPESQKRIGIFAYYVDQNDKPYFKKRQK